MMNHRGERWMTVREIAQQARQAALKMATMTPEIRSKALLLAAEALQANAAEILTANALDMVRADVEGLAAPMLKRLKFDAVKLEEVCRGLRDLAVMPDPLGQTQLAMELAEGLEMYRVTCPIGVIGVVFESRPDALVQIAGLCIRSGNAVILKGGREADMTNQELFKILSEAVLQAGMPAGWGALLRTREDVGSMLTMDENIDLIIPRGSNDFVRMIMDTSRIPVLGHADGICHVYVDKDADIEMAAKVVVDSKAQYVAVCNATETLLVHEEIAARALPVLADALKEAGVRLIGCDRTQKIIACDPATDEDWDTEYLDYTLSIRVVDSQEQAVEHINLHGSGHTDAIVTDNESSAKMFLGQVDSGGVYWNCSTRFADGYRYGFGAEVGVSTGKIHARGPMGIEGLCTYKYKLFGKGHTVGSDVAFTHVPIERSCPFDGEE